MAFENDSEISYNIIFSRFITNLVNFGMFSLSLKKLQGISKITIFNYQPITKMSLPEKF